MGELEKHQEKFEEYEKSRDTAAGLALRRYFFYYQALHPMCLNVWITLYSMDFYPAVDNLGITLSGLVVILDAALIMMGYHLFMTFLWKV